MCVFASKGLLITTLRPTPAFCCCLQCPGQPTHTAQLPCLSAALLLQQVQAPWASAWLQERLPPLCWRALRSTWLQVRMHWIQGSQVV